jgi:hypothetical protein
VIQPATEQNPGRGGVSFSIVPRDSIVSSVGSSSAPYNAADGTFELVDIPPGSYWVSAQFPFSGRFEPGGPPPPRPPVAVAAVDVRNGDVDGVVLSVPSGNTISGQIRLDGPVGSTPFTFDRVNISLGPTAPVSFGMSRGFSPVRPLADGSFRIENVFPGEYQLGVGSQSPNIYVKEARLDSVDVLNHPLNVAGPVSSDLQIILGQDGAQISGTVVDDRQQPVANASVVLVPDRRERLDLFKSTVANASGQFTIQGVAPGAYKVFAWEAIEQFSYFDPDVLRQYEQNGKAITIEDSSKATIEVKAIR